MIPADPVFVIALFIAVVLAIAFIAWIAFSFYCEDCKAHDDEPSEPTRFYDWSEHGD